MERTQRTLTLYQVLEFPNKGVEVGEGAPQESCYWAEEGNGEIITEHRKDNVNQPEFQTIMFTRRDRYKVFLGICGWTTSSVRVGLEEDWMSPQSKVWCILGFSGFPKKS